MNRAREVSKSESESPHDSGVARTPCTSSRAHRTRLRLQHALKALLDSADYESIVVDDICASAGVSRATFYVHYSSKDDLKRAGLEHVEVALLTRQHEARVAGQDVLLSFALPMLEHARDHRRLYKSLAGSRGGAVALARLREILESAVRRALEGRPLELGDESVPREFVVQFVVGAFFAVMTRWLEGGAKRSPEQLGRMFREIVTQGLRYD